MESLRQSVTSYVIEFIKKWKKIVLPIIKNHLDQEEPWLDLTNKFKSKKGCKITYPAILEGEKVYGLVFWGCKGMAEKWELTNDGNIKKDVYNRPIVKVYSTSVALVPLDLIVKFISTDEILPVNKKFSGPYGFGQKWIEKLIRSLDCNPKKDLIFFFVSPSSEISYKIRRFLKEMEYIVEGGYLKKKGFLQMDGPQWQEYYPSDELTNTSKFFLSASVEGSFDAKRLMKLKYL